MTRGTACVGLDPNPKSFTFARTYTIPQYDCRTYTNTATLATDDAKTPDSDDATVKVCGPAKNGALTIGFWQKKNRQGHH